MHLSPWKSIAPFRETCFAILSGDQVTIERYPIFGDDLFRLRQIENLPSLQPNNIIVSEPRTTRCCLELEIDCLLWIFHLFKMPPRMSFLSSSFSLRNSPRFLQFVRTILTRRYRTVATALVELPLKLADTLFELQNRTTKASGSRLANSTRPSRPISSLNLNGWLFKAPNHIN